MFKYLLIILIFTNSINALEYTYQDINKKLINIFNSNNEIDINQPCFISKAKVPSRSGSLLNGDKYVYNFSKFNAGKLKFGSSSTKNFQKLFWISGLQYTLINDKVVFVNFNWESKKKTEYQKEYIIKNLTKYFGEPFTIYKFRNNVDAQIWKWNNWNFTVLTYKNLKNSSEKSFDFVLYDNSYAGDMYMNNILSLEEYKNNHSDKPQDIGFKDVILKNDINDKVTRVGACTMQTAIDVLDSFGIMVEEASLFMGIQCTSNFGGDAENVIKTINFFMEKYFNAEYVKVDISKMSEQEVYELIKNNIDNGFPVIATTNEATYYEYFSKPTLVREMWRGNNSKSYPGSCSFMQYQWRTFLKKWPFETNKNLIARRVNDWDWGMTHYKDISKAIKGWKDKIEVMEREAIIIKEKIPYYHMKAIVGYNSETKELLSDGYWCLFKQFMLVQDGCLWILKENQSSQIAKK